MATFDGRFSRTNYGHILRLEVIQVSQSVENNTSTVNWSLKIIKDTNYGGYSSTPANNSWAVNIHGTPYGGNFTFSLSGQPIGYSVTIATGSTTVGHNGDGTLSISVSSSASTSSNVLGSASNSGSMGLTTIPRASTPTVSPAALIAGSSATINTNRLSASFTHDITYSFGSATGSIATGVGASTTWTPPLTLMSQFPNNVSGTLTITVTTKSGATVVGTKSIQVSLSAPASMVPTLSGVTHEEATLIPDVDTIVGAYVRGISTLDVAISGASGVYGSTITSAKIEIAGQTINGLSGTTSVINTSGALSLVATVTDSRGRVATHTQTVNVLNYSDPAVAEGFEVNRSTVGGTLDPNGTYLKASFAATVQSLIVGTQKNALSWNIKVRDRTSTTDWALITPVADDDLSALSFNDDVVVGTFPINNSYTVRIEVSDALGNSSAVEGLLPTGGVQIMLSRHSDVVGFGKYPEQYDLSLTASIDANNWIYQKAGQLVASIDVSTLTDGAIPRWNASLEDWEASFMSGSLIVGSAMFWPGTSNPPGFAIPLDGRTLVNGVATHSALAAAHPEWVSGNDILIPNYGGRTMISRLPGDPDIGTLGALYGSKTHTLTANQSGLRSHTHGVPGGTAFVANGAGGPGAGVATTGGGYQLQAPASVANANASEAHNNMQPSAVGQWCVIAASSIGEYDPVVQAALVAQVAKLNEIGDIIEKFSSAATPVTIAAGSWQDLPVSQAVTVTRPTRVRVTLRAQLNTATDGIYCMVGIHAGGATGSIMPEYPQGSASMDYGLTPFNGANPYAPGVAIKYFTLPVGTTTFTAQGRRSAAGSVSVSYPSMTIETIKVL